MNSRRNKLLLRQRCIQLYDDRDRNDLRNSRGAFPSYECGSTLQNKGLVEAHSGLRPYNGALAIYQMAGVFAAACVEAAYSIRRLCTRQPDRYGRVLPWRRLFCLSYDGNG